MSNKKRLTPWFAGSVKPFREGVYLRKVRYGGPYSYWTGETWGIGSYAPKLAATTLEGRRPSRYQNLPWLGLAQEAKP